MINDLQTGRVIPREVRSGIARELSKVYSELSSLDDGEFEEFSLARVLLAQVEHRPLPKRENEVIGNAATLFGQDYQSPQRMYIPLPAIGARVLGAVPGAKGGYLVGVDTRTPADVLRPWSVVASSGAMLLMNLRDNVQLPRTATAVTASWIGENDPGPSETPPTLGNVSLAPKTSIALIRFSMQLLKQGEAVEQFLRAQLMAAVGGLLDAAFFSGAGGAQPLGLFQTSGIGTQSGTSLAHAGLLTMKQKVLTAGGRESNLQWVGTPAIQETLGARERATGGGRFLWDDGSILGRPANTTKDVPASTLTVGDFGQAVVGIFGPGIRIDIDPSQDFYSAGLVARVILMCDVAFQQPAAFCVSTSIT